MNRKEAEKIFRGRKTIVDNLESIVSAAKGSAKYDLADQGQLDLFGAGLEVEKAELILYSGPINTMAWVRSEMDVIGVPYTYNPLDDLDMYKDLYCTHDVTEIFDLNEDCSIIVMDWITGITHHKSKEKGNPYIKIYTSLFGAENFWYLWGKDYQSLINRVFISEIFLFELKIRMPTPEFSKVSINVNYLNNIKDVDIDSEYKRIYNASKEVKMDKEWIETNKPEWL